MTEPITISFKHWNGRKWVDSNAPKQEAPQEQAIAMLGNHRRDVDKVARVWALFVSKEKRATFFTHATYLRRGPQVA